MQFTNGEWAIRQEPWSKDEVNPDVERATAQYWVDEYHKALLGDKDAQQKVQSIVNEWAHLPSGSAAETRESQIRVYMGQIDPRAARAINQAMFEHDGSIRF